MTTYGDGFGDPFLTEATFSGAYVREPRDFSTVATEAMLIAIADDPENPVVSSSRMSWDELTPEEAAALTVTIDLLITRKEGVVDGYLRAGGYAVPMEVTTVNTIIQDCAVRLIWNDLRYRKGQLTDEQYAQANKPTFDLLQQIQDGSVVLNAPEQEYEERSGIVHSASSAPRIFSRDSLKDF